MGSRRKSRRLRWPRLGSRSSAIAALGLARAATGVGPAEALPDLVSDAPTGAVLQTYVDSDLTQPHRLLLRFNGYVHNQGTGAARDRRPHPGQPDDDDNGAADLRHERSVRP